MRGGCAARGMMNDGNAQARAGACVREMNEALPWVGNADIVPLALPITMFTEECAMSRESSGGFDPLADLAKRREGLVRADGRRKVVKRIVGVVVLVALVVGLMHVLGGTGQSAHWSAARQCLAAIRKGTDTPQNTDRLYRIARGIEDKRGNRSALAGLYTVCALQSLADGLHRKASFSIGVLRESFAEEHLFADHWDGDTLRVPCEACSSSRGGQGLTCGTCGGSGRVAGLQSKLRGAPAGSEKKTCLTCSGKGRVSDRRRSVACKACAGNGSVVSDTAVREHRRKALLKARILVLLKQAQCALSLRPATKTLGESRSSGVPE